MIFENDSELRERVEALAGRRIYGAPQILEDTSNYLTITGGVILRIGGRDYFVLGEAKEGRFGIGEQPKFWVKHAVDLTDGSRKIIKLVFHEQFTTRLGMFLVRCRRSPEKESAVLRLVEGDGRFMQGITVRDPSDNPVRIIDLIEGKSFFNTIAALDEPHERYYHETLPGILVKLVGCIEAMDFLHRRGLEHGDIRNDHILIDRADGAYRWIDFDYTVNYSDYDVWSLGNVLTFAMAKGIVTCKDAEAGRAACQRQRSALGPDDSLLVYAYRLANLRKVYPYVDPALNDLLMRFSAGAREFFTDVEEVARHLRAAIGSAFGGRAVRSRADNA